MALTFITRASLPQPTKGFVGKESVAIHVNGQVTLSGKAVEALGSPERIAIAWDATSRNLYLIEVNETVAKKVKGGSDACPLLKEMKGKGAKGRYFAASAILQDTETFGEGKYDYKASGNQTFEVTTADEKIQKALGGKTVFFKLPQGAMAPRPVVKRAKKVKVQTMPEAPKSTEDTGIELEVA